MPNDEINIKDKVKEWVHGLEDKSSEDVLKWAFKNFRNEKIAIASSFGLEDVVLIDIAVKINPNVQVFTLDTGRLYEETYELMEKIRDKYNIKIKVYFPDAKEVEKLETERGFYSFRKSYELRRECCNIRKVFPMKKALNGLDAWITGLRREQAITRINIKKVEYDEANRLIKINPLADWTEKQILDYIKKNDVPYNKLHDKGFPSIGCAPCTRAIKGNEDIRAGRWWWESPEHKECGLHLKVNK